MCGARVRKCVASLGAAAAARPWRADGKTNQGPARGLWTYVCESVFTSSGATFHACTEGAGGFYRVLGRVFIGFYFSWARSARLVVSGLHCVSGDLTRTFLLPSFRVVVCLRWCLFTMCFFSATELLHILLKTTRRGRNSTKCPFIFFLVVNLVRYIWTITVRNNASLRGCQRPNMTAMGGNTRWMPINHMLLALNEQNVRVLVARNFTGVVRGCHWFTRFSLGSSHAPVWEHSGDGWRFYRSDLQSSSILFISYMITKALISPRCSDLMGGWRGTQSNVTGSTHTPAHQATDCVSIVTSNTQNRCLHIFFFFSERRAVLSSPSPVCKAPFDEWGIERTSQSKSPFFATGKKTFIFAHTRRSLRLWRNVEAWGKCVLIVYLFERH